MLIISDKQMLILGGWNLLFRLNEHLRSHTDNSEARAILVDEGVTEMLWAQILKSDTSQTEYEIALRLTFSIACLVGGRDPQKEIHDVELMEDSELAMKSAWAVWAVFQFSVLDA